MAWARWIAATTLRIRAIYCPFLGYCRSGHECDYSEGKHQNSDLLFHNNPPFLIVYITE
jgi:hypothetical protein